MTKNMMRVVVYLSLIVGILGYFNTNATSGTSSQMMPLRQLLEKNILPIKANVSVAYTDIFTGETLVINDTKRFNPASVIKVPVMIETYRQISQERFKFTDKLVLKPEYKVWGSGQLFYAKPGTEYTIRTLMENMIIHSDNTATKMLIDLVGMDNINQTMRSLGLTDTVVRTDNLINAEGLNFSKPSDMNKLMYKLYKGEIVSKQASDDMIGIMLRQQHRWGIPRVLPPTVQVANKTGTLTGIRNDSGIILYKNAPYILTIFTRSDSNQIAQNFVKKVSLDIYKWKESNNAVSRENTAMVSY